MHCAVLKCRCRGLALILYRESSLSAYVMAHALCWFSGHVYAAVQVSEGNRNGVQQFTLLRLIVAGWRFFVMTN